MKLLALHHVQITIPVGSEEQAREFYCDLLGLLEIPKPNEVLRGGGFWVELEGIQIHIGAYDQPTDPDSKNHVAFLVDDLEEWRQRLRAASVAAYDGRPIPGIRRFDIRDPFNNRIEFLEKTVN